MSHTPFSSVFIIIFRLLFIIHIFTRTKQRRQSRENRMGKRGWNSDDEYELCQRDEYDNERKFHLRISQMDQTSLFKRE